MLDTLRTLRLRLLHIGFASLNHRWQFERVISPFSRLYLITGGDAWVFHNDRKYTLKPGYLYLIPSYTDSKYHCDHFMEQYYISFLDEMEEGLSIYETLAFTYEVKAQAIDYHLFKRLLQLNPDKPIKKIDPKAYDNRSDLLSFNLPETQQSWSDFMESQGVLLQLFSRFLANTTLDQEKKIKSYRRLAATIRFIHRNIKEKLTVEELAEQAYLHPDYFSRLFMSITGVRPIEYIQKMRMERAQLLLTTTNAAVSEIAEEVGIPNVPYFSRLFKRNYNISPARYRTERGQV
ncbi:MAG: AraC family transcriptional regulator [Bacteroidota bacterium]